MFDISALSSDKNLILVFDPLYKISTIFSLGSILHTVLPSPFLTLFNIRPPFEMFYEICYLSTTKLPYGNIESKKIPFSSPHIVVKFLSTLFMCSRLVTLIII